MGSESTRGPMLSRRRQFCGRCGQVMFEFFTSPDGHFGLVREFGPGERVQNGEIRCRTCGARYRLLERLSDLGQAVEREP